MVHSDLCHEATIGTDEVTIIQPKQFDLPMIMILLQRRLNLLRYLSYLRMKDNFPKKTSSASENWHKKSIACMNRSLGMKSYGKLLARAWYNRYFPRPHYIGATLTHRQVFSAGHRKTWSKLYLLMLKQENAAHEKSFSYRLRKQ